MREGNNSSAHGRMGCAKGAESEGRMTIYTLNTSDLNNPQYNTLMKVLKLAKSGTQFTDVVIRKDAIEYRFEADWLQELKTDEKGMP